MGINELGKHLTEAARREIAQIEKEQEAALGKLKAETEMAAEKGSKRILEEGIKEALSQKKRVIARAKIKAKENVEKEKLRIIESVFEGARACVLSGTSKQKKEMLEKMARDASKGIENPIVFVDPKYASLLPSAKTREIGDFGVIVVGASGVIVKSTINSKLEALWDGITPEIAKLLFMEDK